LKKVSIIIPMPKSHQELNALYLIHKQAAIVLKQERVNVEGFVGLIRKLLFAHDVLQELKNNIAKIMPHNSTQKISEIIVKAALK